MNFYSDEIINDIIDNENIENIIDEIDLFKLQYKYILTKYSFLTIYHKYINHLLKDSKIIIAFYCLDNEFYIYNCPSILAYKKIKHQETITYYILLFCTKRSFRGQGYGSRLLDEFKKRIYKENEQNNYNIHIVLSSIEESVIFYENYGFKWTRKSIIDYPILLKYENYEKDKEYFIMKMIIR